MKKEKNSMKIDLPIILGAVGILVLVFIAVAPPMLRVLLPEDTNKPVTTPPPVEPPSLDDLIKDGTLTCQTQNEDGTTKNNIVENYTFINNGLIRLEKITVQELTENSTVTMEDLALKCDQGTSSAAAVAGLDIYCDSSAETKLTKTEMIDYPNLDLYAIENLDGYILEFKLGTTGTEVREKKEANGYSCMAK